MSDSADSLEHCLPLGKFRSVEIEASLSAVGRATTQIIHLGDEGSPKGTEQDDARFLGVGNFR